MLRPSRAFLCLGVALPFFLRSAWPLVNFDDAFYIQFAAAVSRGAMPYRDFVHPQLPLVEFLLGVIFRVTGPSLAVASMLTAVMIWATAYLLWRIGSELGGARVGAMAAILWAWAPPVVAHHLFEREFVTALVMVLLLRLRTRPVSLLVALSLFALFSKFTFIFAVAGFALALAVENPVRGLQYAGSCAVWTVALLIVLIALFGETVLWQAFAFQSMKGGTPLVERLQVFAKSVGPWAVLAIAGAVATAGKKEWRPVAILALATSLPFVLLGPTFWSHNAIDCAAPIAILAAAGLDAALARHWFARAATAAAILMLALMLPTGRLEFVGEGIDRSELDTVAATIAEHTAPGEPILAPTPVLVWSDHPSPIIHPEYLGVYRWIILSVERRGLWRTWRESSRRGFYENRQMEKWRWEEDAYRAMRTGVVRVVVVERPRFSAPEDALDPARIAAVGFTERASTDRFAVWAR